MAYDVVIGRNKDDLKKFGKRGLINIGKAYVKMGQYTSLSNSILMDVARSHVILVSGKRGSGKSYTLGVLTEELSNLPEEISSNIASLIFDTMGIYWTMKYANEKDKELLQEWNLNSKNLPVKVFVPHGRYSEYIEKGISPDEKFALDIMELEAEDWISLFGLGITDNVGVLIQRVILSLKNKDDYNLDYIMNEIKKDRKSSVDARNAAESLFEAAKGWGIFSENFKDATQVKDLITGGMTSVLDLSTYSSVGAFNIRALVISLISKKIFKERMDARKKEEVKSLKYSLDFSSGVSKKENPLVWLFIDECHEFLPKEGKTIATDSLIQLLREGRQPGVSVVLATQQPGKIHTDVMTQSDIVISHRVTSAQDLDALNQIMQSYLYSSIKQHMDDLPHLKGSAIVLDDNSERIYPIRIRPRFTWHGGEAPIAIKEEKSL